MTDAPSIDWTVLLDQVARGGDLTAEQTEAAMADVLADRIGEAQLAGLLMALRTKGETATEITGLVRAMRTVAAPLTLPDGTIDIVGTGGNPHRRDHALNVSTMASFVAAAAGATVCKHGNFRASSTSGSFDFLAALGVTVDLDGPTLERCVAETGLGFALAKVFHPSMRFAGPVRTALGVRTVFNLIGPPGHPGHVRRQVIGVALEAIARPMAEVLAELGAEHSWVVTGEGGLDEISTTGPSVIYEITPAGIERLEIDLRFLGIERPGTLADLAGGGPEDNARIFRAILDGSETAHRKDIVCLNAGAGLVVAGRARSLAEGLSLARAAVDDGRAAAKLDELRTWTNENAPSA